MYNLSGIYPILLSLNLNNTLEVYKLSLLLNLLRFFIIYIPLKLSIITKTTINSLNKITLTFDKYKIKYHLSINNIKNIAQKSILK